MSSFVNAIYIDDSLDFDHKLDDEVESLHKQIMEDYDESVLEAFSSIFQSYSLDFILGKGVCHVDDKKFIDDLRDIKAKYMQCIKCFINNNYKTGKSILQDIIDKFSLFYSYDFSNERVPYSEIRNGLYKLNHVLIYLNAYIEKRVII